MKGRYPVAVLFLEMDPSGVDVNIHPAKREVRFHDDFTIRHFVVKAVQEALQAFSGTPAASVKFDGPANHGTYGTYGTYETEKPSPSHPSHESHPSHKSHSPEAPPLNLEVEPEPLALQPTLPLPEAEPRPSAPRPEPIITNRLGLRVLGCVAQLYLVAESPEGLVLIDQHAAHERVLFELMLRRMALQDPASQQLLFPVTLEFLPREADFLLAQIETLQQAGVGITRFGPSAFLVDALPAMVKPRDVGEFIRTVVTDLQQEGGETRKGRRLSEEVVAKTVCRHAVKANDALKPAEWDQLVHDLLACDLPYTCPHGRPTMIQLTLAELDKKFGRVP
jgi:DNA mismatch repair protein MutL